MITLVLATRNAHKAGEIRSTLRDKFHFLTLADFPEAPHVIEDAETFGGNAAKKAGALADWLSAPPQNWKSHEANRPNGVSSAFVLADDSGLEVDALGGAPGV